MKYRIEISSVAEAEADNASLRLARFTSLKQASEWYLRLLESIESLSQMPNRCALARESENFSL